MDRSLMIKYNELSDKAAKGVKRKVDLNFAVTHNLAQTLNYVDMKITEAIERRENGIATPDQTLHPLSNLEPVPDSVSSKPIPNLVKSKTTPDPVKSKTVPNPINPEPVSNDVASKLEIVNNHCYWRRCF